MKILWLLLILTQFHHAHSASKGVTASLKAKWPQTPLLLETSEFICESGEEKFWPFVDTVRELAVYKHGESVRSYYNLIVKKAGQFLTDLQVSLLKLSLSLRAYSPTVHTFLQIASDEPPPEACSAFVSVHGQLTCSTKDMKKLLKTIYTYRPKPYLYKNDHKYPGANGTDLPVVILYAKIGTKKFNTFHKVLSERAEEGKLIYVLRHYVAEPKKQNILLSGYGVELAIKSTEYKAVDDTQVKGTYYDTDEVQGFLFGKLKHPLWLIAFSKVRSGMFSALTDLSFQAAARIMSVPKFDSLKLMRDLSQNFPSRARSLTRVAVNQKMRKEIEENQKVHFSEAILDIIRGEAKLLEGLHNLGIRGTSMSKFLRMPVTTVEESYALDIRHSAIMVSENISENGIMIFKILKINFCHYFIFCGHYALFKKIFFQVLFFDPAQEESIELVKLAELFYKHKIPLRIGFVFVVNTEDKVNGFEDAGVAFFRLWNYIAEEYDVTQAFLSMVTMYNRVDVGDSLSVETVTAYLKKKFPKANTAKILGVESSYDDKRKAGAVFYRKSGLGALPVALFNGIPLSSEEMDPDELETILLQRIMDTTNFFQRAVFMVCFHSMFLCSQTAAKSSSSNSRVGVINNPGGTPSEDNSSLYKAIWASFLTQTSKNTLDFTLKLLKEDTVQLITHDTKIKDLLLQGMDQDAFEKKFNTLEVDFLRSQQRFCQEVLKLKAGQRAVVSNGRILGPFTEDEEFSADDFHLLEKITLNKHSVLHLAAREDEVFYDVVAIVDPLTRDAQKLAPLLSVLGQVVNMRVQVFMNCRAKLSEMPLKSFYRFVMEAEVSFLGNDTMSTGPVARFTEIPESPLLTLNMITPESWMVEAVRSPHDLDNIHLQEVSGVVNAEYELEYLLLEGHCFDMSSGQPPRGLQFTLGMKQDPLMQDTIVMANLGYFQLKANPGAWILRLRKGRSEDIYQIQVQKKPDKLNEDLLSEATESKGLWDSITSVEEGDKKKEDVLNIFSVASGHLYERFLRIMMLSVLRHTKTPVKFWFLKNYLSPSFKETIPHMAEAYGFQYELVQYKWPRWLHQQTEKQRIIWGHKILFLDVLFPLAVDKIIFVDADQIVRADLKELRELDLEGAPYGYTPFCDSRREMEGYRFWKTGYWASHLAHRKYHISALYVVDLKKFRKIAAGDRLRGQYQALSQDPNSLSNLDQDLPNNMIHQVAIKSLPQEWLWCETWCDDSSKPTAKTIDLCNNPKTKEPKLSAAVRIVPEWTSYDSEIKQLLKRVQEQKPEASNTGPSQTQTKHTGECFFFIYFSSQVIYTMITWGEGCTYIL
uniref:UDP-glucose ceramide glucosyltransferase-like 1 n=1 Tax=Astyanax mexicanus TaxID=7994 RepID=A0A8B9RFB9_ASTMX